MGLHLHDALPRPVPVHEPRRRREVLEPGTHLEAVGAVTSKQLVEEGLRLGAFPAAVAGPLGDELSEGFLDLLATAYPVTVSAARGRQGELTALDRATDPNPACV